MSRATIFSPTSHLGLGINHLYHSMIGKHLEALVQHGHMNTLTGKLIRCSLESMKLKIGEYGDLFSKDYKNKKN